MSESKALLLTDVVGQHQAVASSSATPRWPRSGRRTTASRATCCRPGAGARSTRPTACCCCSTPPPTRVDYALAYHRALAGLPVPLKARAGLHVGPVILRENDADDVARGAKPLEVDGLAKPTAARVMSLARGGQTLLTPEALAALGDRPICRTARTATG